MYTQEEIINKFKIVHGDKYDYSKVIYTKMVNNVVIICPKHGEFIQTPHSHLKGQGCPKCGNIKRAINKTYTTDIFCKKAKKIYGDEYDYSEVKYVNSKTPICIICPEHGKFFVKPSEFLNNKRICPECSKNNMKKLLTHSQNEFIDNARKIHGNKYDYSKVNYINNRTKVCIICPKHGEFWQIPYVHLKPCDCPKCAELSRRLKQTNDTKSFINKAILMHKDKYLYTKTVYNGYNNKVIITCPKHGDFEQIASYHLSGNGCPECAKNESIAENELFLFIESLLPNEKIYKHYRKLLANNNELDVYIPSHKIAFEFDGLYWHNEINKPDKSYHLNKTIECEKNNIRLIHIFEDEWMYKKDIWKSMIKNMLNKNENKIFARKCVVKEITNYKIVSDFLDKNHLQGKCKGNIFYGLYYKDILVSLMVLSKLRLSLNTNKLDNSYELVRFCNKLNTTVIGGASKLLKNFIIKYNPNQIVSYADRRWSQGGLYERLGFNFIKNNVPSYYYVIGNTRKHRFNFRKEILIKKYGCNPKETEQNFCFSQGWYRIYDCGTKVYKWLKSNCF